jgi:hypothetical protein
MAMSIAFHSMIQSITNNITTKRVTNTNNPKPIPVLVMTTK